MLKKRIPKVGDRVDTIGHNGMFMVYEVSAEHKTAKLALIRKPKITMNVSWDTLGFLDGQTPAKPLGS